MDKKLLAIAMAFLILLAAFLYWQVRADVDGGSMKLNVSSTAFGPGDRIPVKYTCSGEDVSPPLSWDQGPSATASYALIVDDPDAPGGTFTHWVLFNVPSSITRLDEHVPATDRLDNGAVQGKNDFGKIGYGGPCPPPGKLHHYHFRVYALDTTLSLGPGTSKADIQRAMGGHILAEGDLTGVYGR